MNGCDDVRDDLLAYHAGRLEPVAHDRVREHLEACPACAHEAAAEQALTDALESRLPQYPAPLALKRRLAAAWPTPATARPRWHSWRPAVRALVAVTIVVAAAAIARLPWWAAADASALVAEAVNDHLRVVEAERALPVASSAIHEVRPWFTGRIDFAPVVPFPGDNDFPLRGGSVERFLDRKAAVFVYGRRLHTISLLVVPADGLPWPPREREPSTSTARGFNVVRWRNGELGYALVSDVDTRDLTELAARLGAR